MIALVLATRNRHKVLEIQAILGDGFRCLSIADLAGAPELKEEADTFAGNALAKASQLAEWLAQTSFPVLDGEPSDVWVVADDSGLEVDALKGAPGVLSARLATDELSDSGNAPDVANNAKLLRLLADTPAEQRTARFRCVLALVHTATTSRAADRPGNPRGELFEGVCEGRIGLIPKGPGGFGYDPLFVPTGFEQTFAELGEATKNRLSHRSRALAALAARLEPDRSSSDGTLHPADRSATATT